MLKVDPAIAGALEPTDRSAGFVTFGVGVGKFGTEPRPTPGGPRRNGSEVDTRTPETTKPIAADGLRCV